jgi:hypothetical protein
VNERIKISILNVSIDAHGGMGAPYIPPKKDLQNWSKNAIKHENRGPPRFSHNPKNPLQKKNRYVGM